MTNLERIQKMDLAEFKRFLSLCDFNNYYPIVEGKRFWSDEELDEWFNKEVEE